MLLEPTDLGLLLAGIGVLWFEVELRGSAGHASAADRSASALEAAIALVTGLAECQRRLNADVDDQAFVTVDHPYNLNIGTLTAGDWQSSVPSLARLGVRFGFPRQWTIDEAVEWFGAAVADVVAATPMLAQRPPAVRPNGFRARGYAIDPQHELVDALAAAHQRAHRAPPPRYGLGSTTDARFYLNEFDVPAVCYGPRAHRHPRHRRTRRAPIDRRRRQDPRPLPRRLLPGAGFVSERVLERANHQTQSSAHWCTVAEMDASSGARVHQ